MFRTLPLIVPTRRAAILLALAAPLALVVAAIAPGAWVAAPALGGAMLLVIVADAMTAGRLEDLRFTIPGDVEVGADADFLVHATFAGGQRSAVKVALDCDTRLVPGGRCQFGLLEVAQAWRGRFGFAPLRRGTGTVEAGWLQWTGPLGLGARQLRREVGEEVRVWPNIGEVRSPALQLFLKNAQYGLIARRFRGEGTEFEALSEYQPGMDRRRIDWKASARHVQLFAKEYEIERNNQIVFSFDCGQTMCEPVAGIPRIDRAVSAALLTGYVALKGGDRIALFGFAARPEVMTPFIHDAREFHRLQRAAAALDYHAQEPNFTLALATLSGRLQRRSLIIVFSDFTDLTSADLMIESIGRLVSRHLVLFVSIADEELETLSAAEPGDIQTLSMAVTSDLLLKQRALVIQRLRALGVDVIEAPYNLIGTRLIDAYFRIKRAGAIG